LFLLTFEPSRPGRAGLRHKPTKPWLRARALEGAREGPGLGEKRGTKRKKERKKRKKRRKGKMKGGQ
jgi:hypothetical protein